MSKASKIIYIFVSIVFFVLLNGFCTDLILRNGYKLPENPIFDITFIQNQGAAFNIFEGYKVFLITFSMLAIIGILFYTIKNIKRISGLGLFFVSLLLAGIFSNMLERILFGYVRDYINLNFVDFPVFNLSDIYINIGVLAIVIIIMLNSYLKK